MSEKGNDCPFLDSCRFQAISKSSKYAVILTMHGSFPVSPDRSPVSAQRPRAHHHFIVRRDVIDDRARNSAQRTPPGEMGQSVQPGRLYRLPRLQHRV
ncbi:protein of unknown function [Kyrpidia spormannii]|uniref:Uncharacterized protein n=1 Tax=Kyrpidia spormannii TaxID=2055160 RepID=A0ACA8ZBY2_9BACL|nr:protein of unknown function [Kyrpidia spormannii]